MIFRQESDKKSVQFKLKGIFAEATGYRDIKSVLEQEHGLDVKFVSMGGGEARVRLVGGSDSASEVGSLNVSYIHTFLNVLFRWYIGLPGTRLR